MPQLSNFNVSGCHILPQAVSVGTILCKGSTSGGHRHSRLHTLQGWAGPPTPLLLLLHHTCSWTVPCLVQNPASSSFPYRLPCGTMLYRSSELLAPQHCKLHCAVLPHSLGRGYAAEAVGGKESTKTSAAAAAAKAMGSSILV